MVREPIFVPPLKEILIAGCFGYIWPFGILLHDGDGDDAQGDRSQTVRALEHFIGKAKKQGYQFLTVSELITDLSKTLRHCAKRLLRGYLRATLSHQSNCILREKDNDRTFVDE